MNILIPDSWLREHLKTAATPKDIAKILSLTSVSVEKINQVKSDQIYDIEVTTNRVDLMSVSGIAQEASAVLPGYGIDAKFSPVKINEPEKVTPNFPIDIKNDSSLVNRICAVVMDVTVKKSPEIVSSRLEASDIRSLNNLIDITNYVMREIGHPTHVFDLDRLNTSRLVIRKSEKGEEIKTLDGKAHVLMGGDIIAVDDDGRIVDLLGIMGTENSVVNDQTRRILFFVDNNNPTLIRNTSMNLGIRTEAAVINEKGLDPNLSMDALLYGIQLYKKWADGKVSSKILDIYPNKPKQHFVDVKLSKVDDLMGITIPKEQIKSILKSLDFGVEENGENLRVSVPSKRLIDVKIPEDIIEEIARVYGYHKIPIKLPAFFNNKPYKFDNSFYYEARIKNAMKYLGFTEVYTYSLVSEEKFEGPIENALAIQNPLSEEMAYLRKSLIPSLLSAIDENKKRKTIKIFEIANTYLKKNKDLPEEVLSFAAVIKSPKASLFEAKGLVEGLLEDLGIRDLKFKQSNERLGANITKNNQDLGYVEILNNEVLDFELNFEKILSFANLKKKYKPPPKFPPIIEDITIDITDDVRTEEVIESIKMQSELISEVSLLDQFGSKKTFHIIYQNPLGNLSSKEITTVREDIVAILKNKFSAKIG